MRPKVLGSILKSKSAFMLCIALGETAPSEQIGDIEIRFVPYQKDPEQVARYHQAADIYIHPARADTFPTTIIEALACGTPVVATAVGGIPEQIVEGKTGFLVPVGDAGAMWRSGFSNCWRMKGSGRGWGGRPRRMRHGGLGWREWWGSILSFIRGS